MRCAHDTCGQLCSDDDDDDDDDGLHLGMGPHGPDAPRPYYTGLLCPISKSWEPCSSPTKASDGPQAYTLNILWFQKKGTQIHMSE